MSADEARELVRSLAARGGDPQAVADALMVKADEYADDRPALTTLALTALVVTFGECLPRPAVITPIQTPDPNAGQDHEKENTL